MGGVGQGGLAGVGFDQGPWTGRTRVETDPTRTCQLLVGLPDVVVLGVDACAGGACGTSAGLAAGLSGLRDPGLGQAATGGAA